MKQQVEESVKEDIIKLGKVNAPTREIAEHVSKSSGQMFTETVSTNTTVKSMVMKMTSMTFLMTLSKMAAMLLPNMMRIREFEYCLFKPKHNLGAL